VPKVEALKVRKEFAGLQGQHTVAIEDISFAIEAGECVCIVGRTGCGKSTLLAMVLGLEAPTSGQLLIDSRSPSREFAYFRGRLAAVFQTDRLLPWRSAIDNARVGLEVLRFRKSEQLERAGVWLDRLGLAKFKAAYPHELSGGMRQRVAIARAFAIDPDILLLDEAFGHLDEVTGRRLRSDFVEVLGQTNKTCVIVTHNIDEAIETGTRILVLGRPGRVLQDIRLSAADRSPDRASELRREIYMLIEGSSGD
jgi:NitT/TauT family transport system ATP-binding protein